ncbi:hypothetical protein EMIHUDRAFT_448151, partial [Emiliania huxleyi CCMP1516]|uniref:Feruloyl esterase n=2 Tax=Emiliania huxleyi TaxID=2903 RepID=A0A0D3ITN7_EMIH1
MRYRPASGQPTQYRLMLPQHADGKTPLPLVLSFHGWAGNLSERPVLLAHGRQHGYIVAAPTGFADDLWPSWNGGGSTRSPGRLGATCLDPTGSLCLGGATATPPAARAAALLDELLGDVCVDASRVFATGVSNGAIFLYELASDPRTAGRFAGYAPVVGSPHAGFNAPPLHPPAAFFGVWGELDTTVPPAAANAS